MSKLATTDHPIHRILAHRWSPCGFAETPVPQQDLKSLFEAARWSASSYNEQPWRYIIASSDDPEEFEVVTALAIGYLGTPSELPYEYKERDSAPSREESEGLCNGYARNP